MNAIKNNNEAQYISLVQFNMSFSQISIFNNFESTFLSDNS